MKMRIAALCTTFVLFVSITVIAQSGTVVFREGGFPAADSVAPPDSLLERAIPGAKFANASELKLELSSAKLLVLPFGSAFPESAWAEIHNFLQRGGNLLVLGGRPFTRAAYREGNAWKLRDYSVRYTRPLMIDQYQETPGSDGLQFESNPDIPLGLSQFSWKRGFSPLIHLSAVALYPRGGSAGSIDANLDALAWGTQNGRRMSAPVIQIDHFHNGFDNGRWIFVDAELSPDFYASAKAGEIVSKLAQEALEGAEEFTVRPVVPLYLPGEEVQIEIGWRPRPWHRVDVTRDQNGQLTAIAAIGVTMATVEISIYPEQSPQNRSHKTVQSGGALPLVSFPAPQERGLHVIEARLLEHGKPMATYHSAFWVRDFDYLRSGPNLSVNHDYFEFDGKPLAVMGTTYMSSEVQRLYFDHPNVYVWDRDMHQIHDAGLNMLRTGWWTGWDKLVDENGVPYERTLRTLEAYLMTARKYGLPVQFNLFAFLPDVLGGVNAYLDPEAVRKQVALVSAIAARFHDVPFLAYDLINEPSFSKHLWTMRPNGDWIETQKWNEWLDKHYGSRETLATAWNVPVTAVQGAIALPQDVDFAPRAAYDGGNPLKIYDYEMFAQESFANWVRTLREAIRAAGSNQLITVGQDEGGFVNRLSPAFFAPFVDFTTNHSWWQNDAILWDSLVAKQPDKPMLIQETGLQRELNLDQTARRTPENEAALLERKIAMSFVYGSGAIQWLWNTNSYMTEGNEVPIGALRADGTEKPEATVMRNFANFAAALSPHLRKPESAQVAVIASQAAQYSAIADMQIAAQKKAVRALAYCSHLAPYVVYENQIEKMGSPKLAILPSAQALAEVAWQELLKYVDHGGNLLITGPIDRDEHWKRVNRAEQLIPGAHAEPLTYHNAKVVPEDQAPWPSLQYLNTHSLSFNQDAQSSLESLSFGDMGFAELNRGKGRIFWAAEPVELAEGDSATAAIYSYVAARIGLQPQFETSPQLTPGVMTYPITLDDSILYVFVSDARENASIELRDKTTGAQISFTLAGQHAAMALIGKKEKAVTAKYGF